jgi:hypothetical protein
MTATLNLSRLTRWIIGLGYAGAAILTYNADWSSLNEIVRIPIVEVLVAYSIAGLIALGLWIAGRFKPASDPAAAADD